MRLRVKNSTPPWLHRPLALKPESLNRLDRFGLGLKKNYALTVEGKNPDRLLDASKHDLRKYVKRERAKLLPVGVDFWDFDCKLGVSQANAATVHFAALMTSIDALVAGGATEFYVEVTTKHGHRMARPVVGSAAGFPVQIQGD